MKTRALYSLLVVGGATLALTPGCEAPRPADRSSGGNQQRVVTLADGGTAPADDGGTDGDLGGGVQGW
jgi:hypothetical protein